MARLTEQHSGVARLLSDAGYSDAQIAWGFEYAADVGSVDEDEFARLALSRILYSDQQLADGDLVPWERL